MLSSTLIYCQRESLDKLTDILDPVFKLSTLLQKELNAGQGNFSITSASSTGNLSARSNGNLFLDVTQTISAELQDIFCPQLICMVQDFVMSSEDTKLSLTFKKAARKMLEQHLKPINGVSSEAIRKNKILECLKTVFSQ